MIGAYVPHNSPRMHGVLRPLREPQRFTGNEGGKNGVEGIGLPATPVSPCHIEVHTMV
jgi:hypothetical protein